MIGRQGCVTLMPGPFGERLVLVWLVPLVRLVQIGLGVCFALVLFSDLSDFIFEFGHFLHLNVALRSLTQLGHATRWHFAQIVHELVRA